MIISMSVREKREGRREGEGERGGEGERSNVHGAADRYISVNLPHHIHSRLSSGQTLE